MVMMITERERLLLAARSEVLCPYDWNIPLEGGYGPKTCGAGCYDEPGCEAFVAIRQLHREHRDLFDEIVMAEAFDQVQQVPEVAHNLLHPLHDWIAERDPDYASNLDGWRAE
jgi:hypothetical protein